MALTEEKRLCDLLVGESSLHNRHSREEVTVLAAQSLVVGEVVGKVGIAVPTTGTAGTNTGNGTMTGVSGGSKTQKGTYTAKCITAAANGGTFRVEAPDGSALPDAVVGTAYVNAQINLTINDGSTDFAVNDTFTIAVADGSGKVVAVDFAAVDGSQNAAGISIGAYGNASADVSGVILSRDAVVREDGLVWPDGASAAQMAGALLQLEARGIVVRSQA